MFKCSAEAITAQMNAYLDNGVVSEFKVKMGLVVWDGLGGSGAAQPEHFLLWMDNIMWEDEMYNGCCVCGAEFDVGSVVWDGCYPLCEGCANAHAS